MPISQAEFQLRIKLAVLGAQAQPTLRDRAQPAPLLWHHTKYLLNHTLRVGIARIANGTAVLVFHTASALLELLNAHQHSLENVEWFETGDDDRYLVPGGDWLIFPAAHDRANVTGGEEGLNAAVRRTKNGFHCGRNQDV